MIVVQLVIGLIVICLQCEAFTRKSLMHSEFSVFGEEVKAKNGKSLSADVQIATAVAIHEETGFDPQRVGAVGEAQRHSAGIGDRRGGGDDRRTQLDEVELHCPVDALRGNVGMVEAHQLPLPVERSVARQFVAGGGEQEGEEHDKQRANGAKAKRIHR